MIQSSSCPQWQLDRPGPAGDHDGLAVVTPLTGTRSRFDQTSCGVTRKILTANRGSDANAIGQQSQIILALCRALLGDGEGPGQIHSPSKCRAVSPPTQDRDR